MATYRSYRDEIESRIQTNREQPGRVARAEFVADGNSTPASAHDTLLNKLRNAVALLERHPEFEDLIERLR